MNWKDEQTDELLARAKAALTDEERAKNYMLVQERVMEEHLWMPVANVSLYTVSNKRLKGCTAAHALREHVLQGARPVVLKRRAKRRDTHDGAGSRGPQLVYVLLD